jgi:hypothetical protein
VATATSNFTVLGIVLAMNRGLGMQVHAGAIVVGLLPVALLFGVWPAAGVLGIVAVDLVAMHRLLTVQEKRRLVSVIEDYCGKFRRRGRKLRAATP